MTPCWLGIWMLAGVAALAACTSPPTDSPFDAGTKGGEPDAGSQPTVLAFALLDPNEPEARYTAYLARADVDGIAVRMAWADLQPAESTFQWTKLDAPLQAAKARGKLATLHLLSSSYSSPPQWVFDAGAQSYSETPPGGGPARTQAVPWDLVYLSKWSAFVDALAAHLTTTGLLPVVRFISVAVPVPEMSLVSCSDGLLAPTLPYSRASYLGAWRSTVTQMDRALPAVTKLISAPVRVICRPDDDGPRFFGEVLDLALGLGPRFALFAADLNALGSARLDGVATEVGRAPVGLQFIGSYTSDPMNRFRGPLLDGVCRGLRTYGATYFEVYKPDLDSTDAAAQLGVRAIHDPSLCPPP